MNAGSIWWGQIGNSLRLLTKVTNNLRDCRSAVLQVPRIFPWRQDFYDAVDVRRSAFGGERRLRRLSWEENADPGAFILDELCFPGVRADYWPGQTYAEYLGSRDDILLNEYYVWITGIHSKMDMARWAEFVSQYEHAADMPDQRAVFVLEYDGTDVDISGVEKIAYTVEDYDCRVFCLETAAALNNTGARNYQAELALCIGGTNPELCSALLDAGSGFLRDPVNTSLTVVSSGFASDGHPFPSLTEQQISSAAWKATIVLLFPILEQYRLDFIAKYETELARHLPISNSNGDRVSDPYDLEIGSICYIVSTAGKAFPENAVDRIRLCRKARNLLAHNKPLPYEDVQKVIAL